MSTLPRTLRNIRKGGIKDYFVQMWYIMDMKDGRHVGTDISGNRFFENNEELPLRTRWVRYAKHDYDAAQIQPHWHAWMSYMVDAPPGAEDVRVASGTSRLAPTVPKPNLTMSRGAFKTYSTTKSKISTWEPVAAERA